MIPQPCATKMTSLSGLACSRKCLLLVYFYTGSKINRQFLWLASLSEGRQGTFCTSKHSQSFEGPSLMRLIDASRTCVNHLTNMFMGCTATYCVRAQ